MVWKKKTKEEKIGERMPEKGQETKQVPVNRGLELLLSALPIVFCALLITGILFTTLMVIRLNILPLYLVIAGVLIITGLAFICVALAWNSKKPVRFAVGVFLSIVMVAGMITGGFALKKAWDTAQKVTSASVTLAEVGVYVNAEDNAVTIEDLSGYTFGVLKAQDREDAGKALLEIASELDNTIYVAEYDSVIKLISALYNKEIKAAVMETYHIEMLATMDNADFSEIADLVRLIKSYMVESSTSAVSYDVGNIEDSPLRKEEATPAELGFEDHTFAIYVSGIDSYGAVNVKSRSDVNVLAFINDKTHQIFLVSTPRDYYVSTTVSGSFKDKLTHAGLWGPECSMGTLSNLYDVDVDYFFRINFSGFESVVDSLGGIDFCLGEGYPVVHLNGKDALMVARDRTYLGGEVNRGSRHMQIISAVINQAISTDIIYSYNDVLDAVSDSFDTSVPYDLISRMVKEQIETNPSWEIIRYTVAGYGNSAYCFASGEDAYVLVPNYETVQVVHDLVRSMERNERIHQPE